MGKHADKLNKLAEKNKADKIISYLNSRDKETRIDAMRALGQCGGEEAVNHLTTLLITPDPDERAEVVRALGSCGTSATFSFLSHYASKANTMLKHLRYAVRQGASARLCRLLPKGRKKPPKSGGGSQLINHLL